MPKNNHPEARNNANFIVVKDRGTNNCYVVHVDINLDEDQIPIEGPNTKQWCEEWIRNNCNPNC